MRLGGYVILPRMLDKGRATLAGKNGEYHYACPLDQRFLEFAGIDPEALKKELGKSDSEMLEWIEQNAKHKRTPAEIAAWSDWPGTARADGCGSPRVFQRAFTSRARQNARTSSTWFDVLDMDDFVSFGGKACKFPATAKSTNMRAK